MSSLAASLDDASLRGSRAPVVPRDAASLIIVDRSGRAPRFLMGRRNKRHGFMPDVYVFPGGAVEASDLMLAESFELSDEVRQRLSPRSSMKIEALAALPLAAIRETFEETGLLVGRTGALDDPPENWAAFGAFPACDALVPVARAITPPRHPKRYDARFFAVDRSAVVASGSAHTALSDELEDIGWFTVEELDALPLADITRRILSDVAGRLDAATLFDPCRSMPFYHRDDGVHTRDLI